MFLPPGLTIKKQGKWLQRSVLGPPPPLARPADEVSIGCFKKKPEVKRKAYSSLYCSTEMLYSNTRKWQYLCSQHLQACSFDCHTELPSEQRSWKRKSDSIQNSACNWCFKGRLAQKKNVSNDTMKGPECENLCHCEKTPFMHILIREKISNGARGAQLT